MAEPSATTTAATAISTVAATIEGEARNPDLAGGEVSFQYGPSSAYGSSTPAQALGPRVAAQIFGASLSGLAPGHTYHFRVVVKNALGTATGADQTFTTASPPVPAPTTPAPQLKLIGGPSVSASATTISLRFSCAGSVACPVLARATSTEKLRAGRVLALTSLRKRTVTVASAKVTVLAAHERVLTLKLNATGRRLEKKFGRLPLTLSLYVTVGDSEKLVRRVRIVLVPHRHRHR